ncbi:MAG: agarase [Paludibacteraceae bacterium]
MKKHILFALILFISAFQLQPQTKTILVEAQKRVRNNPKAPWKFYETNIVAGLGNFIPIKNYPLNEYGSCLFERRKATGFFRVEKINGRWWYVDPNGYLHLQIAVASFRQGTSPRNITSFREKFGDTEIWVKKTADKLHCVGFNGVASWADNDAVNTYNSANNRKLTYAPILNFMSEYGRRRGGTYQLPGNIGYPNQTIFVFDPEFETFCDEFARNEISKYANDKNLIGYFSDNELPLGKNNLEGYLTLKNEKDPGKLAAQKWMRNKKISENQISDSIRAEFAGFVAEKYYSIVSKAIKKADPNHLYIGSRLHGNAKFTKEIVAAAGKYCDVVSINFYDEWAPSEIMMKNWEEWSGKPFIITEFYTKGEDAGMQNLSGAGWKVHTQKDRGYAYQHFTLSLLKSKNCIGWHWFRYQDNDPETPGADPSNLDANKGLVNNDYEYYDDLMDLMKELNLNAYKLASYFDNN